MENMISRYRDRLTNSSTEIKNLSASREKHQTQNKDCKLGTLKKQVTVNQNYNTNLTESNYINTSNGKDNNNKIISRSVASSESLGVKTNSKESLKVLMMGAINNNNNQNSLSNKKNKNPNDNSKRQPHTDYKSDNIQSTTTNNIQDNTKANLNNGSKVLSTELLESKHSVSKSVSKGEGLKSSRKKSRKETENDKLAVSQLQKQQQQVTNSSHQQSNSRSKANKSNKGITYSNIVNNATINIANDNNNNQISPEQSTLTTTITALTNNIGESIVDVFKNEINEKNLAINVFPLLNKEQLKYKIGIFLDEYFMKRLSIGEKYGQAGNKFTTQVQYFQQQQSLSQSQQKLTPIPNLQNRLLQSQKQRQFLFTKCQSLTKRVQQLTKQLQRFIKIQKLINNTIEVENQSRREVIRLRRELQYVNIKSGEQQKLWRREITQMGEMIMELERQLSRRYNNQDEDGGQTFDNNGGQ